MKLRELRKRKFPGLKNWEFAAEVGISPGYLSKIELGEKIPPNWTLEKIADKLDLSMEEALSMLEVAA